MHRRHWLAGGLAAVVLLGLAFILTGGVYRTVNAGGGRVYLVNRYTGRVSLLPRPVPRAPAPTEADREAKAIDLVKQERAARWFPEAGSLVTVDDLTRQALGQVKGRVPAMRWQAEKQPDGLHVVSFCAQPTGKGGSKGIGWEVDLDNRVVRFINADRDLAKHYGFDALPSSRPAARRSK